eukprot:g9130.t1
MQSFTAPPPTRGAEYASWLNSSLGRFFLFAASVTLFLLASTGLSIWSSPGEKSGGQNVAPRGPNEQFLILLATLFLLSAYFSLPVFGERCGVGVFDANWKPYIHLFRLSFFFSMPAFLFISLGFGASVENGAEIKGATYQQILAASGDDLNLVIGDYFVVEDMFVGLNLTKAIIKTLQPVPKSSSRGSTRPQERRGTTFEMPTQYSETEYFDAKDALAGPPPPPPTDVIGHYVFAPIFETWRTCITRYAVSSICMSENKLIGFVYSQSDSLCRRAGALSCLLEPKPKLNPSYRCRGAGAKLGLDAVGEMMGLCGRVALPPSPILLDEVVYRHKQDGWTLGQTMACHCPADGDGTDMACPGDKKDTDCKSMAPLFFINADYDERIAKTKDLESTWLQFQLAGGFFGFLTVALITLTMLADCYVDRYLRAAAKYAT